MSLAHLSLAHQLAAYAHQLSFEQLPAEVVHEAKRRVIDSLGCAYGAYHAQPVAIARNLGLQASDSHGATVLGTTHKTTPERAAFASGLAFRYLDFNDTYLSKEPAHPSDNIAACLAAGEACGASGANLITSMVLAYEVQCRLADACSIRAKGWDHVTYGSFSTSLAAGKLLGLNEAQLVHAQGLAGVPNNAMRQTRVGELSHWKGAAFANASRNGVFAAMLAKAGMTGPSQVFEGEMGFFAQVSHAPFSLPAQLGGQGDTPFMIGQTYIKHYPLEYHAQSAVEAALLLREQLVNAHGAIDPNAIVKIDIDSFDAAVEIIAGFKEHWAPKSRETADHSMPYCVTVALLDGDVWMPSFDETRLNDPTVLTLLQKVAVNRNAEMTAGYPDGIPNLLKITLADGRVLQHTIRYPLGHAKNPMTDADVQAKFCRLAQPVVGEQRAEAIYRQLMQLEACTDLSALVASWAV